METPIEIEKEKRFVKKMVIGVGYAIFTIIATHYFSPINFFGHDAVAASRTLTKEQAPNVRGKPLRLRIPSLEINAAIHDVGVLKDGSMGIPEKPTDTAWYKYGPKPGEKGSAVIAGHLNWFYGAKGVFERLDTLKPGDTITTQDEHGVTTNFVVRRTGYYGHEDDATDVFHSNDGIAHLNLVTCAGSWNKFLQRYNKRLVVFTDEVK